MQTTLHSLAAVALVATLAAACRFNENAASRSAAADSAATAGAGSLEGPTRKDSAAGGMAGMQGGMMGAAMGDSIEAHMRMMDGMSAEQVKAMLSAHRQTVANLLSRMNAEMRSMNMPADAAWTATIDSVRQDLTHMPEMSGAELKALMPAHHARVTRLLQAHREMLGRMK